MPFIQHGRGCRIVGHMAVSQYTAVLLRGATDFKLQAGVNTYNLQTSDEPILTLF